VDLITTDGFLHPTAELERRELMHRKGFPESYDRRALLTFISDIKSGRRNVRAPIYSHLAYNIVPGEYSVVDQPDVLIVEGLNVLQTGAAASDEPQIFVSDFFDFSIYVDAEESVIEKWYVDRFLELRTRVFNQPGAYFSHFANLSEQEAIDTASGIWKSINRVNLYENILPTNVADRNFPARSVANHTESKQLIHLDGTDDVTAIEAIVSLMPLDTFQSFAVVQTSENRPYGCFILKKGVVFD